MSATDAALQCGRSAVAAPPQQMSPAGDVARWTLSSHAGWPRGHQEISLGYLVGRDTVLYVYIQYSVDRTRATVVLRVLGSSK